MAKYVCDFDEVESLCTNLDSLVNTLSGSITSNKSNLDTKLSEWNGTSKDAFKTSTDTVFEGIKSDVNDILTLTELIRTSSDGIEQVESQLAAIKI